MMCTVLLLIIAAGLISDIEGAECKLSEKKVKKLTNSYHKKCLKKGFVSSLAGCESNGNPDDLKPRQLKKCGKIEKQLGSCDINCQVDGGWSDYGAWSGCSAECGGGEMTSERECNKPAPQNGGAECQGDNIQRQACNADPCPVDGGWGAWGNWSECSAKCEGGTQSRSKECDDPIPAHGGAECEGEDTETRECNAQPCTVKYHVTHKTGTGKYDGGTTSGAYLFTLIGTAGQTAEHDCSADRKQGITGECTFEDPVEIGKLKGMRIKNKSDNTWVFVSMFVKVDGVLRGRWLGTGTVSDYKTVTINFTYIGDEETEYEITHRTGTGKWDSGARTGAYKFTLIGSEGSTKGYDCAADRGSGKTGTCTIRDAGQLGHLQKVKIQNKSENSWTFKTFTVKVAGEVVAKWSGSKTVPDLKTVLTVFQ